MLKIISFFIHSFNLIYLLNGDLLISGTGLAANKFGLANHRISDFSLCRGPKSKNCSENRVEHDDEFSMVTLSYNVTKKAHFDKMKISTWQNKNSTYGPADYTKMLDNPCGHFLIGPLIKSGFRVKPSSSDCMIEKGLYVIKLNMTKMFNDFLGARFFYGTYKTRSSGYSKDCNLSCFQVDFELK